MYSRIFDASVAYKHLWTFIYTM